MQRFLRKGRGARIKHKNFSLLFLACILALVASNIIFLFLLERQSVELVGLNAKVEELTNPGDGVRRHGALRVNGTALTDMHGDTIQLRGMSTHGLMWYPQYSNAGAAKTIKELGGNVIRLAIYSDQNQGYVYNPKEATDTLFMALENVLSQDMYAIVDWHVLRDEDPNLHIDAAQELFSKISKRYGNHPSILYEICNEPNNSAGWDEVKRYAERVIPLIRQNAPDAVILVGTPNHCTDLLSPLEDPLAFDNIMYTYHQYSETLDKSSYTYEISSVLEKGLPVFVSEWGISNDTRDTDDALRKAKEFLDFLDSQNISWVNWSLCNKEEGSAALNPDTQSLSGWTEDELSASGKFVFGRLK